MKACSGFSLIELVISLAIVAITATIAVSSYRTYILKGHRSDGINSLLAISLAEERYRTNNTTYGTLAQVWAGVTASEQGYYSLAISGVSATAYTITATAQGNQANDKEGSTTCTPLVLTMSAGVLTKTPAACWPS